MLELRQQAETRALASYLCVKVNFGARNKFSNFHITLRHFPMCNGYVCAYIELLKSETRCISGLTLLSTGRIGEVGCVSLLKLLLGLVKLMLPSKIAKEIDFFVASGTYEIYVRSIISIKTGFEAPKLSKETVSLQERV